jgi:hypothetical protein
MIGTQVIMRKEFEAELRSLRLSKSGSGITALPPLYNLPSVLRIIVVLKTDNYSVLAADLGKLFMMNAAAAKTLTLPAVVAADVGLSIMFMKRGAGKLTIQAGGTDTIQDSTAGGTLYNDLAEETFAFVRLRVIAAATWMIEYFTGSGWRTA